MTNYKEILKHINTFIFDYDGVLTDGTIVLQHEGEPLRTANVKDGYALQLLVKKGYRVAVISGGKSQSMLNRFSALRIPDIYLGIEKKLETYLKYVEEHKLTPEQVLYMGDDIPDYEVMLRVGMPACPSDASEEIKAISKYISHYKGGEGCVRDIIEQVLKVQGKWMNEDAYEW
jgi:3-deoxy-D-manno-octulosonate 8-phosphate phosphatase (KDO 8-P phosphatase)